MRLFLFLVSFSLFVALFFGAASFVYSAEREPSCLSAAQKSVKSLSRLVSSSDRAIGRVNNQIVRFNKFIERRLLVIQELKKNLDQTKLLESTIQQVCQEKQSKADCRKLRSAQWKLGRLARQIETQEKKRAVYLAVLATLKTRLTEATANFQQALKNLNAAQKALEACASPPVIPTVNPTVIPTVVPPVIPTVIPPVIPTVTPTAIPPVVPTVIPPVVEIASNVTIEFNDLELGMEYFIGQGFKKGITPGTDRMIEASIIPFYYQDGTNSMSYGGSPQYMATVLAQQLAPNEPLNIGLAPESVNAVFSLPANHCAREVTFKYLDSGSEVNFTVNGSRVLLDNLSAVFQTSLGGALISGNAAPLFASQTVEGGMLKIEGDCISSFGIGGLEFFIDDVSFSRISGPR